MPARLAAAAPVLLAISIAARLAWTYLVPNGANFVDLHVYVGGAGALDHPGTLYDYVYADQTPDFPLPFTYPPFAAVRVLSAAPAAVRIRRVRLAARHRRSALRRGADQPTAAAGSPGGDRRHRDAVDGRRHLDRTAAQHLRLRADQRAAGAGCAVRGLQHAVVAVGPAGRAGRGGEADAGGVGAVLRRRAAMGRGGVLGGRVLRHGRSLGAGRRRPNPLLLHRTARRRQPGRPDRDVVQPVVARRDLADPRPRRGLRAARGGRRLR